MSDLENKKSPVVITIARDFGAEGLSLIHI